MKILFSLLCVAPLFAVAQNTNSKILVNDIYHEKPVSCVNGVILRPIKMECGGASQSSTTIRLNCGIRSAINQPLFVINDCIVTDFNLQAINPSMIEEITILKNTTATEKYGEQGKNGVILIKTKLAGELLKSIPTINETDILFPKVVRPTHLTPTPKP